ncbi:MAG TPA: alpha/beta hydrolase, partial [Candidatus Hydrogenedentes bacterium]|nr:alpha/beta hydrolase [Candidatus Hydrogenedentota bacterium]
MVWILIAGVVLLAALAPMFTGDMEHINLDAQARAAMSGKVFATLSDGVTHYEWRGPENGPKVVLVHGFSSPMFIWDHNL